MDVSRVWFAERTKISHEVVAHVRGGRGINCVPILGRQGKLGTSNCLRVLVILLRGVLMSTPIKVVTLDFLATINVNLDGKYPWTMDTQTVDFDVLQITLAITFPAVKQVSLMLRYEANISAHCLTHLEFCKLISNVCDQLQVYSEIIHFKTTDHECNFILTNACFG